jgi:L-alanine-DL-glutamate epimerase-like enolase superfamily enzyme
MRVIEEIRLDLLKVPLGAPYKLALGVVTHFDTILAHAVVDGREGFGEATVLSGYTDETIEDGWRRARALLPLLIGASSEAGKALAGRELADAPFTRTAFVSALEMCEGNAILDVEAPQAVALLAGINATDPAGIEREVEAALARGFDTLKIKAGFDLGADLDRVAFIQRCNAGRAKLRVDANQGFNREDGVHFAASLSPESIELLEQPCAADDWEAAAAVARVSNVPLMLDESICDLEDIKRAASLGAAFVKLKLMKMGGLDRGAEGLALIRTLGMEPVLGNGVASDCGCWMEACVARRTVRNAGEMNGFLRQRQPLAANPIKVENGRMLLPAGLRLTLDEARLAEVRVAQAHASAPIGIRRMASR